MARAMKGDTVRCIVNEYSEYKIGELAYVLETLREIPGKAALIKLANRKSPIGYAWYQAKNFELVTRTKENKMAAYEKTKYFVAVIDEDRTTPTFLVPDFDTVGPLRDNKSEAFKDAELRIRGDDAGKKLIILQTIALVQEEDPRPPIKITEYK